MSIYKDTRKTGNIPPAVPVSTPAPTTGYKMTPAQQAQFNAFQQKGWDARKAKENRGRIIKGAATIAGIGLAAYGGYKARAPIAKIGGKVSQYAKGLIGKFNKKVPVTPKPKITPLNSDSLTQYSEKAAAAETKPAVLKKQELLRRLREGKLHKIIDTRPKGIKKGNKILRKQRG